MERKIIQLNKGMHRAPTTGAQGELSECVDLVVKDGEIMNAPIAKEISGITIPDNYTLVFIHETSEGKNYILKATDGSLAYMREGENSVAHGEMDEYTKQQKYRELVTPKEDYVKATREQILAVNQQLEHCGTEQELSEANTKMAEYVTKLNAKFLSHITAYDTEKSTTEATTWNALTAVQKYKKINDEDYEDTIIWGYGDDKAFNLYSPGHTVWFAIKTTKTDSSKPSSDFWLVGEGQWQTGGAIVPKDEDKAQMIIRRDPYTYKDDEGVSQIGYNCICVSGTYLVDTNKDELLDGAEEVGDYHSGTEVIQTIYSNKYKEKLDTIEEIRTLTDDYYDYYMVVNSSDNKAILEARRAELETALNTYQTQYETALASYNQYIASNAPIYKISDTYKSVTSVGNVLAVATGKDVISAIYQGGSYVSNNVPNIDLQFRLSSKLVTTSSKREISINKNSAVGEYSLVFSMTNVVSACYSPSQNRYKKSRIFELTDKLEANKWAKLSFTCLGDSHFGTGEYGCYIYIIGANGQKEEVDNHNNNRKYEAEFRPTFDVEKIQVSCGKTTGNDWIFDIYDSSLGIVGRLDVYSSEIGDEYTIESSSDTFTAIQGDVNKFIKTTSVDNDKFMYPFFVRYAFKMFDGTFVYPSAPVLMMPNVGRVPFTIIGGLNDGVSTIPSEVDLSFFAFVSSLQYRVMNSESDLKKLQNFKQLIKEVCIAVSSPIYTYDMSRQYKEGENAWSIERVSIAKSFDEDYGVGVRDGSGSAYSRRMPICADIRSRFEPNGKNGTYITLGYPNVEDKQLSENVVNHSQFYIIKSYTIEEMLNNYESLVFKDVMLEDNTLEGLVGREMIKDNTSSLVDYGANLLFAYNKRLVAGNISEYKFKGYNPGIVNGNCYADFSAFGKIDGSTISVAKYQDQYANFNLKTQYGAVVEITVDGTTVKVYRKIDANEVSVGIGGIKWFYYPSSNAKRVTIYRRRKGVDCDLRRPTGWNVNDLYRATIELKEDPNLDGAYWFDNFNSLSFAEELGVIDGSGNVDASMCDTDTKIILGLSTHTDVPFVHENKIIQTYVNNPFAFDMASAEYVGNGKIKAMSTNAKALSQGQFGQFPIMCFASDGIWSVEISGEGKWMSKQPISRDVILDGAVPCQTDSAVVFPCVDGLKMIAGSEVRDISGNMHGAIENSSSMVGVMSDYGSLVKQDNKLFNEILNGARFLYDSANRLVHLYADGGVHYICSTETGEWSKSSDGVPVSIVAGYPNSAIQVGQALKAYLKSNDDTTLRKGVILTREFCYDNPIGKKLLYDIRVLFKIKKATGSGVKVAVFVSNDRQNWTRLTSLKHSSWKWFRVAIFTNMTDQEGLECFVSDVDEKFTDKIR